MRRGNILLCVTLITLLAPSSPVNKWFSSFGPLQVGATSRSVTTCTGTSYAARYTQSQGYRLCFQDTEDRDNLCTTGKTAWGYVVPPLASTGQADLLLRPLGSDCDTPAKVVGTATFACTANQDNKPIRVTLVITNNPGVTLTEQRIFIACGPNYLQDCPALDANSADTTDCTTSSYATSGYGLGYNGVKKCRGNVYNRCVGPVSCTGDTKTIKIKVNPSETALTGCTDCSSFWWAVKQRGTSPNYCQS